MSNKKNLIFFLLTVSLLVISCNNKINKNKNPLYKPQHAYIYNLNQKLYESIPNPIKIIIPEIIYDSINISSQNAQIHSYNKNNDYYIVVPNRVGILYFNIELFSKNKSIYQDSIQCTVSSLPDPVLYLPTVNNLLNKNILLQMSQLNSEIINLSVDIPCIVKGFQIIVIADNRLMTSTSNNAYITNEQKEIIHLLEGGDYIIFKNVNVEMPNKTERILKAICFEISK